MSRAEPKSVQNWKNGIWNPLHACHFNSNSPGIASIVQSGCGWTCGPMTQKGPSDSDCRQPTMHASKQAAYFAGTHRSWAKKKLLENITWFFDHFIEQVENYKESDFKLLCVLEIYLLFISSTFFSFERNFIYILYHYIFCARARRIKKSTFVINENTKIDCQKHYTRQENISFAMTMGTCRNFQLRFIEGRGIDFVSGACCVSHAGCLLACNINEVTTQNTALSHWFNFSWGVIQSSQFSNLIACSYD